MSIYTEIGNLSPYSLARLAGCATPDSLESPGGEYLKGIRDEFLGIRDSSLEGVSTKDEWDSFISLKAWNELPSQEYWEGLVPVDQVRYALGQIHMRLSQGLTDMINSQ